MWCQLSLIHAVIVATFSQEEGDLRIVNGDNYSKGRLEIYHAGVWGTICDDYGRTCSNFGDVACAQLGFETCDVVHSYTSSGPNGTPEQMAFHGPIPPPPTIWLDEVDCAHGEERIADCAHLDWGTHNCVHGEDIAIECVDPCDGISCNVEEVCFHGECGRDCHWLDIDGFLNDCSQEFVYLQSEITSNNEDISTNTANISTNAGDINSNTADINSNTGAINSNTGAINSNTGAIGTNAGNIGTNTANINSHTAAINSNAGAINSHTGAIGTNAGNISTNAGDISANTGAINTNAEEITRIKIMIGESGSAAMKGFGDVDAEFYGDYSWLWQNIVSIVVIVLLTFNLIIMTYNCCKSNKSKNRYQKVTYMDSEDIDSEANLK